MSEWKHTTLGVAGRIVMGSSPPGETYNADGIGLPFLQGSAEFGDHFPTPVKWCSAPNKVARPGDLLVSVRAPVGDTNFANQDLAIGRGLATISSTEHSSAKFLRLALQFSLAGLLAQSGSGMFTSITAKRLRDFEVSLPPLGEQRRIVAVMDAIDQQIAALGREAEATSLLATSLRRHFFEHLERGGAALVPLQEVASVQLGRMLSKERANGSEQYPYLRNANLQWDGLDLSDLKTMSFPEKEREKYAIRAGDIMVCEGGDAGRSVFVDQDLKGIFYQKALHRVRVDNAHAEFIYQALRSAYDSGRIADLCTVTTIPHLTAEKFKTLRILLPPKETQVAVAEQMAAVEALTTLHRQEREALQATRSALLNALLSREISVDEAVDSVAGIEAA